MKLFLHVGPHKTGTTSIQTYLMKQFGSEVPTSPVWYPLPRQRGPGHSALAQALQNSAAGKGENPFFALLDEAEKNGVQCLILSSEDFSNAYRRCLETWRDATAGRDVTLIVTQNSLLRRATSLWQESLKERNTTPLEDAMAWVMRTPGYQPRFVRDMAEAIGPRCIALVYSSPDDPSDVLLDHMLEVMGLEAEPETVRAIPKINPRLGRIEAEILRQMNAVINTHATGLDPHAHRQLRFVLSEAFGRERWTNHCPAVEIRLPEGVRLDLARRAADVATALAALADDWPVVIRGDPAVLAFDPDAESTTAQHTLAR